MMFVEKVILTATLITQQKYIKRGGVSFDGGGEAKCNKEDDL